MSYIISLCGPDGVGKSTLANYLSKNQWTVQYGGKKSNHTLVVTKVLFNIHLFLKRTRLYRLNLVFLYFIFYPFEFLENLSRIKFSKKLNTNVVFDRFVVDRIWKAFLKNNSSQKKLPLLDKFYAFIYLKCFPSIDGYVFLLPDADVIFERDKEFYKNRQTCKEIRDAYEETAGELAKTGKKVLVIQSTLTPQEIYCKINHWFKQ